MCRAPVPPSLGVAERARSGHILPQRIPTDELVTTFDSSRTWRSAAHIHSLPADELDTTFGRSSVRGARGKRLRGNDALFRSLPVDELDTTFDRPTAQRFVGP